MTQLDDNTQRFRQLESRDILTHQYRCVRVRNRHASCHKCADACTSGCISFDGNKIVIDHSKCIGCCTCCTVCPTCALEAANPNDAALLQRASKTMRYNGGIAVLASQKALETSSFPFDPQGVTAVANVGRVEESLLLKLVVAGAKKIVVVEPLVLDEADEIGQKTAKLVLDTTRILFEAWGIDVSLSLQNALPPFLMKDAREEWLPAKEDVSSDQDSDSEENPVAYFKMKVMKDGTLPHFIPDRREEIVTALSDLGDPNDVQIATRLWGHVVIDQEKCIGCRLCATFCPTGALFKFIGDGGKSGIDHTPGDCVKCMCCQDVCRNNAIRVEDNVDANAIIGGEVAERYEMVPEELFRTNSHSIYNAIKSKTKRSEYLFER